MNLLEGQLQHASMVNTESKVILHHVCVCVCVFQLVQSQTAPSEEFSVSSSFHPIALSFPLFFLSWPFLFLYHFNLTLQALLCLPHAPLYAALMPHNKPRCMPLLENRRVTLHCLDCQTKAPASSVYGYHSLENMLIMCSKILFNFAKRVFFNICERPYVPTCCWLLFFLNGM